MAKIGTYQYVATSLPGFLQRLAVHLMAHGYYFFVTGNIPERKDPTNTDAKILAQYRVAQTRWERARRKRAGLGNVHYLRYGHFFVILATHGANEFCAGEGERVREAREHAVTIAGYSVGLRRGVDRALHPSVSIHPERYRELKAYFLDIAVHRSEEALRREFARLSFEPWAPIRRQLLALRRGVNKARKQAGLLPVEGRCFRFTRRSVSAFSVRTGAAGAAVERNSNPPSSPVPPGEPGAARGGGVEF